MSNIAIDTNIAIAILNGNKEIINKLETFDNVFLPFTVVGELYFGVLNSSKSQTNLLALESFLTDFEVLNSNFEIIKRYAQMRLELKLAGTPILENDIWIAATCYANNIAIYTFDKHFTRLKDIEILT